MDLGLRLLGLGGCWRSVALFFVGLALGFRALGFWANGFRWRSQFAYSLNFKR